MKLAAYLHIVLRLRYGSYTSTPPYAFTAWHLIRAQGQLYSYIKLGCVLRKQTKYEALYA
jgi:hypothetical protein